MKLQVQKWPVTRNRPVMLLVGPAHHADVKTGFLYMVEDPVFGESDPYQLWSPGRDRPTESVVFVEPLFLTGEPFGATFDDGNLSFTGFFDFGVTAPIGVWFGAGWETSGPPEFYPSPPNVSFDAAFDRYWAKAKFTLCAIAGAYGQWGAGE